MVLVIALVGQILSGLLPGSNLVLAQASPSANFNLTAHINGSQDAANGSEQEPVRVENGDEITYQATFSGLEASAPAPAARNQQFQTPAPAPAPVGFINGGFELPNIDSHPTLSWSQYPTNNQYAIYLESQGQNAPQSQGGGGIEADSDSGLDDSESRGDEACDCDCEACGNGSAADAVPDGENDESGEQVAPDGTAACEDCDCGCDLCAAPAASAALSPISASAAASSSDTGIPGWQTRPNTVPNSNQWAYHIEIQKPVTSSGPSNLWRIHAQYTADGSQQYAELNADVQGRLYQICPTEPGSRVYWEFYHAASGTTATNPSGDYYTNRDTMDFYLGAPGSSTRQKTNITNTHSKFNGSFSWTYHNGYYDVPQGQTLTEFGFAAVDYTLNSISDRNGLTQGNFIDCARLYSISYIALQLSGSMADTLPGADAVVNYEIIATNTGESDASNVAISMVLPTGTTLVSGSVAIDGVTTNSYSYNALTNLLTLSIGSTNAKLMLGEGSPSTDCQQSHTVSFSAQVVGTLLDHDIASQAMVTYNDRRYETTSSYVNYSNVDHTFLTEGATLVVQLPTWLTYVSIGDTAGASFERNGQTCIWRWPEVPSGEVTVSVTAQVDSPNDTLFTTQGLLTVGSAEPLESNSTYHYQSSLSISKDAYVASSSAPMNGTAAEPVEVYKGTAIQYRLVVERAQAPAPRTVRAPRSWGQPLAAPQPINFVNGGFELPNNISWNGQSRASVNPSNVPGWTIAPNAFMEFAKPSNVNQNRRPSYSPDGSNQFVAIVDSVNGDQHDVLSQTFTAQVGERIYWEYYHGPRVGNYRDSMIVEIRQTAYPNTVRDTYTSTVNNQTPYQWTFVTGSMSTSGIPGGQDNLQIRFRPNQSGTTHTLPLNEGNFIDCVRVYTRSHIELTIENNASSGAVRIGDTVTYTITAENIGESDASDVVLSFALPVGMRLVDGGVLVGGIPYPHFTYDQSSGTVQVNIGAGATSTDGGLMLGVGSASVDCDSSCVVTLTAVAAESEVADNHLYESQASATYADRVFRNESYAWHVNYSEVDALEIDMSYDAIVTDVIPAGLDIVYVWPVAGARISISGQVVSWVFDSLPAGKTTLYVDTAVGDTPGALIDNHATLDTGRITIASNHTYHTSAAGLLVTVRFVDVDGQPLQSDQPLGYTRLVQEQPNGMTVFFEELPKVPGYTPRGYFKGDSFNPPASVYTPGTAAFIFPLMSNATIYYVYDKTYDLRFYVVNEIGNVMEGVSFSIYSCQSDDPEHEHSWLVTDDPGNCWVKVDECVSNYRGFLFFDYLPQGDYMLVQDSTWAGYQLPNGQWLVQVDEMLELSITAHGFTALTLPPAFKVDVYGELQLTNYPRHGLPLAGGVRSPILAIVSTVSFSAMAIYIAKDSLGRRRARRLESGSRAGP